ITQMVNSLTSKLQIGSPMACFYLLENPDHYTVRSFVNWYWTNVHTDLTELYQPDNEAEDDENDRVVWQRADGEYVGTTNVDDYIHRPSTFDNTSLYDFFQMTSRK
ncbi:hypothetical protein K438DRAFT_1492310, partial [Mycena galopus ATCC 62051]